MEFILVLFICPTAVLFATIIGTLLIKKWYIMPLFTFILFFILTFTVFNSTFLIWVWIYTILSLVVSLIVHFIIKALKER